MSMRLGALLFGAGLLFSTTAFAGDNNTLRVIQKNPNGASGGNALFVDQSGASNSLVLGPLLSLRPAHLSDVETLNELRTLEPGGFKDDPSRPAEQIGQQNSATVVITGNGGQLQLLQDNSGAATSEGNDSTAVLGAGALGAVLQIGDKNTANLDAGAFGTGLIAQNGNENSATLVVQGGGTGEIVQNGNGNVQPLTVNSNTTVTVTQNGNGLQPVGTAGLQVFSTNPGTISITQTGFR